VLVQGLREAVCRVLAGGHLLRHRRRPVRAARRRRPGVLPSLPERAGVVGIPTGVFYDPAHAHLGRHLVRFAFCKGDDVLAEAVRRLAGWVGWGDDGRGEEAEPG
jgi:N-succinyldiaminopimelate aminotransferase